MVGNGWERSKDVGAFTIVDSEIAILVHSCAIGSWSSPRASRPAGRTTEQAPRPPSRRSAVTSARRPGPGPGARRRARPARCPARGRQGRVDRCRAGGVRSGSVRRRTPAGPGARDGRIDGSTRAATPDLRRAVQELDWRVRGRQVVRMGEAGSGTGTGTGTGIETQVREQRARNLAGARPQRTARGGSGHADSGGGPEVVQRGRDLPVEGGVRAVETGVENRLDVGEGVEPLGRVLGGQHVRCRELGGLRLFGVGQAAVEHPRHLLLAERPQVLLERVHLDVRSELERRDFVCRPGSARS